MVRNSSLRLGFAGTPEFAASILKHLIEQGFAPVVVLTQPDRPTGRGRKIGSSPVKQLALEADLPVYQPDSLKNEALDPDLDVLIVAAYGLLLPPHILAAPRFGCLNVHASLLPRWRGAAPIERAIMAGDRVTGVTIMQMDEGLDTGPTFNRIEVAIEDSMTGLELERILANLGGRALIDCLKQLGTIAPEPQHGDTTYAKKLSSSDSVIDWHQPVAKLINQVRALSGRMPASATRGDVRIRILSAQATASSVSQPPGTILSADKHGILIACGEGALRITRLQLNRGKGTAMDAAAAVNGYADVFTPGQTLNECPSQ
jgi:methionyl-tRNA formyltransferase